ncbi:hypothetical protein LPJ73_000755 [Coemansia sp. RSA 2703]|nr:hypothetical protein LPJ73_000755 [Coemansia sp. RSA 2703]KAJ2377156.1 hypothetical protein IW150_001549 [Coemansia sp. RSA 2607]KAJ2397805.1 hypothetical protein GGI05_000448 [Coemansia sp. RSA 2603]
MSASVEPSVKRKYDILIWGATSFTGERLVEYLAANAPEDTRIAIGGRNRAKLEGVRAKLSAKHPSVSSVIDAMDIIVGDSADSAQMHQVASQTRVIASTVGPYARYGTNLVRACVNEMTDYCDITGEVPWVKQMHCELNDQAVNSNVHIASLCGFDCIPADLGCMMLAEHAREKFKEPLLHVKGSIVGIRGGVSGGTLATMSSQISAEAKGVLTSQLASYKPSTGGGKRFQKRGIIHYDKTLQRWQTFWLMAPVNTATANWAGNVLEYGPDFEYEESMSTRGLIHALAIALGLFYGMLLMMFSFTRRALYALKIIPKPGEGPSESFTQRGFFSLHLEASTENHTFYGKVAGSSDPGYGETIKYLGESALCLAFDRDESFRPGVYPPSVIMGDALLRRLRNKNCVFRVSEEPIPAVESSKKRV